MLRILFFFIIFFGFQNFASAQQPQAGTTPPQNFTTSSPQQTCGALESGQSQANWQRWGYNDHRDCVGGAGGVNQDEQRQQTRCDAATQRFQTSLTEMNKANCGTIGSCLEALEECERCGSGDYDNLASCGGADAVAPVVGNGAMGNIFGTQTNPEVRNQLSSLNNCPIVSRDDLKEWRDLRDDFKKEIEEADKDLLELNTKKETEEGNIEEARIEMQNITTQLNRDLARATEDSQSEHAEALEQLVSDLNELKQEYNLTLIQQRNELNSQVYNVCHQRALEQIEAIKRRRSERAAARQLAVKSLSDLASLTSLRKKLTKQAEAFKNNCINSGPMKSLHQALLDTHKAQRDQLNSRISSKSSEFDEKVKLLEGSKEDKALRRKLEDLNSEAKKENDKQEREIRTATRKLDGILDEIRVLEQQKREAEMRYNEYVQLVNAASARDPGDLTRGAFVSAASEVRSNAQAAAGACKCEEGDEYSSRCPEFDSANDDTNGFSRTLRVAPGPPLPPRAQPGGSSAPSVAPPATQQPSGNGGTQRGNAD